MLRQFLLDESAPTMVEYGLLIALIGLIVAAAAAFFGLGVSTLFSVPPDYFS